MEPLTKRPKAIRTRLAACAASLVAAGAARTAFADNAPKVEHTPLSRAERGKPQFVRAKIKSATGAKIFDPAVLVRVKGATTFSRFSMLSDGGQPDRFVAELPASLISGDFGYYIEAFDDDGNGPGRAGAPESPLKVSVGSLDAPVARSSDVPPPPPPPPPEKVRVIPAASSGGTVTRPAPEGRSKMPTIALGAAGGAAAAAAVICGVLTSQYTTAFDASVRDGWRMTASDYRSGQTFAMATNVTAVAAGVLAAGALIYAVWPSGGGKPSPAGSPSPAPSSTPRAPGKDPFE